MSFRYKYKTSTLTPFVKPHAELNLSLQNVFYVQSALRAIRNLFYYQVLQNHIIICTKCPKMTKKSLPTICLMAYVESTIIYKRLHQKVQIICSGFEPGSAGQKVQTLSLGYGHLPPPNNTDISISGPEHVEIKHSDWFKRSLDLQYPIGVLDFSVAKIFFF